MIRKLLVIVLALLLLTGCVNLQPETQELTQYNATFLTLFDTVTTIVGYADSEEEFQAKAQAVHDELLIYHQLFDISGTITADLTAPVQTKNELGENYGMVAWGGAVAEWNEQAASFAAYVTNKTAADVAGIAVEEGKPTEADLVSSVTIRIGDFQALIAKAMG